MRHPGLGAGILEDIGGIVESFRRWRNKETYKKHRSSNMMVGKDESSHLLVIKSTYDPKFKSSFHSGKSQRTPGEFSTIRDTQNLQNCSVMKTHWARNPLFGGDENK